VLKHYVSMYPMHLSLDGAERELMFGREPQYLRQPEPPDPMPIDHLDSSGMPPMNDLPECTSEGARRIYEYIRPQPALLDEIALQAGMSPREAMNLLTELELYGCVTVHPGSRYSLK